MHGLYHLACIALQCHCHRISVRPHCHQYGERGDTKGRDPMDSASIWARGRRQGGKLTSVAVTRCQGHKILWAFAHWVQGHLAHVSGTQNITEAQHLGRQGYLTCVRDTKYCDNALQWSMGWNLINSIWAVHMSLQYLPIQNHSYKSKAKA